MNDKMTIMEGYVAVYLAKKLSAQTFEPTMLTALRDIRHSPIEWRTDLSGLDPRQQQYIVTQAAHYKERPPFPDFQHEFITLTVQLRPGLHSQPPEDPVLIKVSRTILGNTILARLGIYGAVTDTIRVLGSAATYHIHHYRLNYLTWTVAHAPLLVDVAALIAGVHRAIPMYCLIKSSCYAFARAVIESIHLAYNGAAMENGARFLTRRSYFLGLIPAGATRAQTEAELIAFMHTQARQLSGGFIYSIYFTVMNV